MIHFPLFSYRHHIRWWENQNQGFFNEELYEEVKKAKEALEKMDLHPEPKIAISTKTVTPWNTTGK